MARPRRAPAEDPLAGTLGRAAGHFGGRGLPSEEELLERRGEAAPSCRHNSLHRAAADPRGGAPPTFLTHSRLHRALVVVDNSTRPGRVSERCQRAWIRTWLLSRDMPRNVKPRIDPTVAADARSVVRSRATDRRGPHGRRVELHTQASHDVDGWTTSPLGTHFPPCLARRWSRCTQFLVHGRLCAAALNLQLHCCSSERSWSWSLGSSPDSCGCAWSGTRFSGAMPSRTRPAVRREEDDAHRKTLAKTTRGRVDVGGSLQRQASVAWRVWRR